MKIILAVLKYLCVKRLILHLILQCACITRIVRLFVRKKIIKVSVLAHAEGCGRDKKKNEWKG